MALFFAFNFLLHLLIMIKYRRYALFAALLFLALYPARAQDDGKAKQSKNRFSLELLGDPFSVHFERRIVQYGNFSMYAGAGTSLVLQIVGEPNFSFSLSNSYRATRGLSLFALGRAQLMSLCFPQIPLSATPATSGYVRGRNHLGINTLNFSLALGASFHAGKFEISPLYPAYNYALGTFAGEEVHIGWYKSVSLNSRIYYHF
jgi:hypothetical protein